MVQILPRFDPGGEIGRSIGSGAGQALSTQADRQRMLGGLEALNNLDLEKMSYGDLIKTAAKGFVGLPGGMQVLQEVLPGLIKQKQSIDYARNAYGGADDGPSGGSVDLDETSQLIEKSVPGGQEDISMRTDISDTAPMRARAGARPELAPTAQKVPGLEEDIPAYRPMTNKDRQAMAMPMARAGIDPANIQEAINKEEQRRRDEWKGLVEAKKARTEQFAEERGLEDVQEDRIRNYIAEETGVKAGELDPYEIQKGYELFKNEQAKNPNMKDRQLWSKARQDFNAMRESFSRGQELLERPGYFNLDAPRRLKLAKDWAQGHQKRFGNFRQDREKLMTMFMQQGFTRPEASAIVKPMSSNLEKSIKELGAATKKQRTGYQGVMEEDAPLRGKERDKYLDDLSTKISKNLNKDDSLVLLREKLVRDNKINETDFSEALQLAQQKMEEEGKTFNPEQQSEIPYLKEKVKPSLMDMFFGDESFDLRKYIPRLAE